MVEIFNKGNHTYKSMSEQYGVKPATLSVWVKRYNKTKSFDINDNRTEKEKEIIALKKRLKQLEMENDLLKQAAILKRNK